MVADYVLLDTDTFSAVSFGKSKAARYDGVLANTIQALTFVSVAELLFGALHAGWGERRTADLKEKIGRLVVLPYDGQLPATWARVRDMARRAGLAIGQPMHANDLWIAACAVHYDVPLLTENRRHFVGVPGLKLLSVDVAPKA